MAEEAHRLDPWSRDDLDEVAERCPGAGAVQAAFKAALQVRNESFERPTNLAFGGSAPRSLQEPPIQRNSLRVE
jgi:hypothetical protein